MLRTDHGPLRQILTKKGEEFSNRQMRWLEKLSDFTFEVMHLPGSDNKAADALSRAHVVSALEVGEEVRQHQLRGWEEIREAADQDPEYVRERGEVEQGLSRRGKEVRQGVIIDQVDRILVPRGAALMAKLVLEAHEPSFCGHFGAKRTQEVVSSFRSFLR